MLRNRTLIYCRSYLLGSSVALFFNILPTLLNSHRTSAVSAALGRVVVRGKTLNMSQSMLHFLFVDYTTPTTSAPGAGDVPQSHLPPLLSSAEFTASSMSQSVPQLPPTVVYYPRGHPQFAAAAAQRSLMPPQEKEQKRRVTADHTDENLLPPLSVASQSSSHFVNGIQRRSDANLLPTPRLVQQPPSQYIDDVHTRQNSLIPPPHENASDANTLPPLVFPPQAQATQQPLSPHQQPAATSDAVDDEDTLPPLPTLQLTLPPPLSDNVGDHVASTTSSTQNETGSAVDMSSSVRLRSPHLTSSDNMSAPPPQSSSSLSELASAGAVEQSGVASTPSEDTTCSASSSSSSPHAQEAIVASVTPNVDSSSNSTPEDLPLSAQSQNAFERIIASSSSPSNVQTPDDNAVSVEPLTVSSPAPPSLHLPSDSVRPPQSKHPSQSNESKDNLSNEKENSTPHRDAPIAAIHTLTISGSAILKVSKASDNTSVKISFAATSGNLPLLIESMSSPNATELRINDMFDANQKLRISVVPRSQGTQKSQTPASRSSLVGITEDDGLTESATNNAIDIVGNWEAPNYAKEKARLARNAASLNQNRKRKRTKHKSTKNDNAAVVASTKKTSQPQPKRRRKNSGVSARKSGQSARAAELDEQALRALVVNERRKSKNSNEESSVPSSRRAKRSKASADEDSEWSPPADEHSRRNSSKDSRASSSRRGKQSKASANEDAEDKFGSAVAHVSGVAIANSSEHERGEPTDEVTDRGEDTADEEDGGNFECDLSHCAFVTKSRTELAKHRSKAHRGKGYTCEVSGCTFKTTVKKVLAAHLKSMHEGKHFPCEYDNCAMVLDSLSMVRSHQVLIHGGLRYKCDTGNKNCAFITPLKSRMEKHRDTCFRGYKFACDFPGCTFKTDNIQYISRHKDTQHERKRLTCPREYCSYSTVYEQSLINHENAEHKGIKYYCDYTGCKYSSKYVNGLKMHKKVVHLGQGYHCTFEGCNYATHSRTYFNSHSKIHEKRFPCEWENCDFLSRSRASMKEHQLLAHGKVLFTCEQPECNFQSCFAKPFEQHQARKHSTITTENRVTFRCDEPGCSYNSTIEVHYANHKKFHHGVHEKIKCSFPGCKVSMKTQRGMSKHEKSHAGKYKCNHRDGCKFSTNYKQHLRVHFRKHTGVDPRTRFACEYPTCTWKTLAPTPLRLHQIEKHGGLLYACDVSECTFNATQKDDFDDHMHAKHPDVVVDNVQSDT